jgi:HK97 family phage major capsid protein
MVAIQKRMARQSLAGSGGESLSFSADETSYKQGFLSWMRSGREGDLEAKAMSIGSDPDGGYTVPKQIDSELTKVLRELSPMRQIARVVQAETSDYSMIHSVGGTGYTWVGEKSARPETNTPTFQKISPPIGEIYANPGLTQAMLDDSGFNIEDWIVQELSEAFDAGEGDAFLNGSGINKPRGFLTYDISTDADGTRSNNALQYVASGASGDFSASAPADKLVALVHSLRPRYRKGASWLMNTDTLEQLRTMKDGSGRYYLWQPSLDGNMPETILGYPVFECADAPDIAANSLSIAFGNFMIGYTIVDRSTLMLRDPFTNKPYVHFYTSRRVGGAVRDTRAIKLMKFAAS